MKNIKLKSYVLGILFILVNTPIISSSSIFTENNQIYTLNASTLQLTTNEKINQAVENITESLLRQYLEELISIGPKRTGTYGCDKAAEYLFQKFEDMELEVRYQKWAVRTSGIRHRLFRSQNVEAIMRGNSNIRETIVFNAHYDTVKQSPGANDDGSGVVAVLAAANVLRNYEFNRTIKFVQFSGEEVGLLGSREYVEEIYDKNEDVYVEFNADMIGYAETATGGRNTSITPTEDAKWMIDEIKEVNQLYGINLNIKDRWKLDPDAERGGSDYYYFVQKGYEAIAFWQDEHNPDYWHTPEDTIEHINFSYLTNMTRLIVASIAHIADIENKHPRVQIGAPRRGRLYIEDRNIREFKYDRTWVIDDFCICVEVKPGNAPIEKVEFYIDGELKNTDIEIPYQWRINERSFRKHKVKVIAYDIAGRTASDQLNFLYINLRTKE